jgi:hypothetical protein
MKEEKVKKLVRNRYAKVAKTNGSCCASRQLLLSLHNEQVSKMIGYSEEEMNAVPKSNLRLGCGNRDCIFERKVKSSRLGFRAGFDCFGS